MNFDSLKFAAIVADAKTKAAGNAKWIRAIERAAAGLLDGSLIVTLIGSHSLVTSANGSYWVNGVCQCAAAKAGHRECKHRAAVRLVEMYEASMLAVESKPATREEIEAAIRSTYAAKFPGYHVADFLMKRFGCNSFRYLPTGLLQDILAAIA